VFALGLPQLCRNRPGKLRLMGKKLLVSLAMEEAFNPMGFRIHGG
jgi:hypothetical protein